MKSLKKSLLVFLVASPMLLSFSCSRNSVWRTMWDAAVAGASDWVQDETFSYLDDNVDLGGTDAAE